MFHSAVTTDLTRLGMPLSVTTEAENWRCLYFRVWCDKRRTGKTGTIVIPAVLSEIKLLVTKELICHKR